MHNSDYVKKTAASILNSAVCQRRIIILLHISTSKIFFKLNDTPSFSLYNKTITSTAHLTIV